MPKVNFVKHLRAVFVLFARDGRLNASHISLYMALFHLWNLYYFQESFSINRHELMQLSKIGSKSTYHRVLKQLHSWGYILYFPSHNPLKGSRVSLFQIETSTGQDCIQNGTSTGQLPYIKHIKTNKQLKNEKLLLKKSILKMDLANENKQKSAVSNTDKSTSKDYKQKL